MPNGVDRNFVRYISCIGGFRAIFNHWPTKVRLDSSFIEELKEVMKHEDYQKMTEIPAPPTGNAVARPTPVVVGNLVLLLCISTLGILYLYF